KLADRVMAYLRAAADAEIGDEEAKARGRNLWYLIADVQATSRRDALVPKVYDEIIKRYGTSDELLGRLAAWHKSKQQYEPARATYRRYASKIEGLAQVAESYRQEKKFDLAITTYRQLLGQAADASIRWKTQMAAVHREIPNYPEAIGMYTELLSEDAENAASWRWRIALAHRDANQLKEAIGHFRQCANFPENYKQMAWCHRRLKQFNEALLLYNQVAGGHEASAPWAVLQIGYTREEAGQKEAAIRAFQQVCKRYPKDSHASAAHAHLQNKYKLSITLGGAKDE
ncbi:MAG: tetratricopeptide repeat protein, partial [Planctomycetales bacterium]